MDGNMDERTRYRRRRIFIAQAAGNGFDEGGNALFISITGIDKMNGLHYGTWSGEHPQDLSCVEISDGVFWEKQNGHGTRDGLTLYYF